MRLATCSNINFKKSILFSFWELLTIFSIKLSQKKNGLFEDSTLRTRQGDNDNTYAMFTGACLCIYNFKKKSKLVDSLIIKLCYFIKENISSSGSIAYHGRAANSSYLESSALLILSYCFMRFNLDNSYEIDLITQRIFKYKSEYGLPTSLNFDPFSKMSGYHGSFLQYSALSAVLINLSVKFLQKKIDDKYYIEKFSSLNSYKERNINNTYITKRVSNSSITFAAKGYLASWKRGDYTTGYGGICSWSVNGEEILSSVFKRDNLKLNQSLFIGIEEFKNQQKVASSFNKILIKSKNKILSSSIELISRDTLKLHLPYTEKYTIGLRCDFIGYHKNIISSFNKNILSIKNKITKKELILKNIDSFKLHKFTIDAPSGETIILEIKLLKFIPNKIIFLSVKN